MTNEEAIKLMRSIRRTPANWILEYEAIDKAIEALEKQTPRKPTHLYEEENAFTCPRCDEVMWCDYDIKEFKYCCECGQAIDWSD